MGKNRPDRVYFGIVGIIAVVGASRCSDGGGEIFVSRLAHV
ncbi:hypothetical protein [Coleofasciculus chthonoplastes]